MTQPEKPTDGDVEIDLTTDPNLKGSGAHPLGPEQVQELIGVLEREAKALGNDSSAARLHHEMGLLWEGPLKNARNAAVCYQNAYRLAPKFVANLRAARRLFAEVGNWQMVAQLLDAEAAAVETEDERAALMLEKARVLEDRLGKADDALALLNQCRGRWPSHAAVLEALEAAIEARNDPAALKEIRVALAGNVQDPALAAQYLVAAARLCEGPLGQPSEAAELYRRAFHLRRDDLAVLAAVERSAERKGDLEELLASLSAQAERAGAAGAPIWYRISRVYERMNAPEKALEALSAGRKVAPHDPVILDELARTYEGAGRFQELAEVLQARIARLTDSHERVGLNLRLGALWETVLANEDAAIGCYRTVLEVAPANQVAVAGLGKLYAKKQAWQGLLEVLEIELGATDDARQKAGRLYKAAELLETRLSRTDDAIRRYHECLQLQPGYLPAQKALVRLFERLERWDDLIAQYEADLKQTSDRDQTLHLLSRIAGLQEERKKDLPASVATLKRILDLVPDHLPTVRNLGRLCERAGMWDELIRTNDLEASLAGDSRQVISLFHTNAEIYEEQLKQKDQAIEAYKKLLLLSANYLPALKALGRLYAQSGRWEELVEMNRQEAEITPSPDQAAGLIFKSGELLEEKLGRTDDAIAAFQEVLTLSPSHFPALRALSRIYRAQKAWENLVEVLRAEAAARTDAAEKANTLFRVAALWEDELGRADLAIEAYQSVLSLVPNHGPAFRALERLFSSEGNWKELGALLERELGISTEPDAKAAVLEKLAALSVDRFQDLPRAERHYEAVLELQPRHLGALKGLEALRLGDRAKRAEVRSRLAEAVQDPKAAASLQVLVAFDQERLGLDTAQALGRAAEHNPDDPRVIAEYVRALRRAEDWQGLFSWYERRLASQSLPAETRLSLNLRLAEVAEWHLGLETRALAAWRAALEQEATNLPALRGARRVLSRAAQHGEVYRLLMTEAAATRDPKGALDLFIEAGMLAEGTLRDVALARAAYQAVLARDPLEPRASERLEQVLLQTGGAEEIAEMHLRRGQGREASRDAVAAAEEYVAAAKIYAEQLKIERKAFDALEQALKNVPTHPGALRLRGDMCLATNRWAEAAQAYFHRLEQGGDATELALLHYRLGVMLQDHLGEPARASAHLQTAYAADPRNVDALERLGVIHLDAANWGGAADVYRRLLETTSDPAKLAKYLVAYAHIAEVGMGDANVAAASLKKALELVPGDAALLAKLAELYERLGNLPELALAFEQQAQLAATTDKPKAYQARLRAGEIYARQNDVQKALQNFRFAVDLAPDQVPARAALADLMTKTASMPAAAIEEHRALLRVDPFRLESYHTLFRLYATSRQLDRAMCAGHVLSFARGMTEAETASFTEARGRSPQETSEVLSPEEMDATLQHPAARHPLADVLRIIGDQLHKVYEPGLEDLGVTKSDRLKADNPLFKLAKSMCAVFGVEKLEVYQGKRGAQITLENTDPLSMVVGPDMVRRYQAREQRFLFARAAFHLRNKMPIAYRFDNTRLADLLGNAIRVVVPDFNRLGKPDADLTKRLRKAMSGKAIRALEQVAPELLSAKSLDIAAWMQAAGWSADRAGLLLSGDIAAALQVLLREDPALGGMRLDSTDQILTAMRKRRDMFELVAFVTSDDHYKLRSRLRLALG